MQLAAGSGAWHCLCLSFALSPPPLSVSLKGGVHCLSVAGMPSSRYAVCFLMHVACCSLPLVLSCVRICVCVCVFGFGANVKQERSRTLPLSFLELLLQLFCAAL